MPISSVAKLVLSPRDLGIQDLSAEEIAGSMAPSHVSSEEVPLEFAVALSDILESEEDGEVLETEDAVPRS